MVGDFESTLMQSFSGLAGKLLSWLAIHRLEQDPRKFNWHVGYNKIQFVSNLFQCNSISGVAEETWVGDESSLEAQI